MKVSRFFLFDYINLTFIYHTKQYVIIGIQDINAINRIRKIIVLTGLILLTLFAVNADKNNIKQTKNEKTNSTITLKNTHSSVFIEPTFSATFLINHKTTDTGIIKWVTTFLIKAFDRCTKVSILLYPFHHFW